MHSKYTTSSACFVLGLFSNILLGLKGSGHDVAILEQGHRMIEVGAGIQMAPNAARVLRRSGLLAKAIAKANVLKSLSLCGYKDNEGISSAPLMPKFGETYNAPLSVINRGDLQEILLQGAKVEDVNIRTGRNVVTYHSGSGACV